jgi:hypothetical protein
MNPDQVQELTMLMEDPATFITLQTNDGGDGRRILNGSAFVRHDSIHREKFLSPARSYHDLPHGILKGHTWVDARVMGKPHGSRWVSTTVSAPFYICDFTYLQVVKAPTRDNVLIPSPTGDTMPRVITSYEDMFESLNTTDDEPFIEEDMPLPFIEEDMPMPFIEEDMPLPQGGDE